MGAKHFGARVVRLEDPALLTGRGRFVDDVKLPGALHACFVRSPHAHARIRAINTCAARAMPGVHAVLTADDLPPRMATAQIPMLVPNPSIKTPRTQLALGAQRSLLRRADDCGGDRGEPLSRRGRRGSRGDRVRSLAGGERLPRRRQAGRGPRA